MVISVLEQKYRCGSNRGISKYEKEGVLEMLNFIIEWDKSEFPKKLKDGGNPHKSEDWEEDRKFLGEYPALNPGDMFVTSGQIFAIENPNTLVLVVTETGWKASNRFIEENITLEFDLFNNFDVDDVEFSKVEETEIPSDYVEFAALYSKIKLFNKKFKAGRFEKDDVIKATIKDSDILIFPSDLYIKSWKIMYNPNEIDESSMKLVSDGLLSWFYREYDRLIVDELPKEEKNEDQEEFNEILKELIDEVGEETIQSMSKEELLEKVAEKVAQKAAEKD